MVYLSKSKYCRLWQCPKMLWLDKYKPEESVQDEAVLSRMDSGNEIGDLAMGLFGNYVEVTEKTSAGKIDIAKMIQRTKDEMNNGTPVICEASFNHNGLYCAVDLLKKEADGWAIYEVKSSGVSAGKKDDHPEYYADVAYQKYVLENCGVKVTDTYLIRINSDYVYDGDLDIHQFFTITDVSESIKAEEQNIIQNLAVAESVLNSNKEPDIDIDVYCDKPYKCAYQKYCFRHIPTPSVFDLYRIGPKKYEYYKKGLITYPDLKAAMKKPTKIRLLQLDHSRPEDGTVIDKIKIQEFLDTLSYPLYFLDFESMQTVIPIFPGTKPNAQVPFQYSLHYIETPGGKLMHKEFLAESGTDPRRDLAEQLCTDIPMNTCVMVYNKAFECSRLSELAYTFPDLSEHLLNIKDNIADLLVPFRDGYYYNSAMGGSFSIKSVLPAIFPDDPSLNYHNLEDVHNGTEAMNIFPEICKMTPDDQQKARNNLLKYCELDTYAMVKVWEELVRVTK